MTVAEKIQTFRYVLVDVETGRPLFNEEKNDIHKFMTITEANSFLVKSNLHVLDYNLIKVNGADKLADMCTVEKITRKGEN